MNTYKKILLDINGISAKVLSQELKILEMNNIIKRESTGNKPTTMRYTITEYGMEIQPIIKALVNWGGKASVPSIISRLIQHLDYHHPITLRQWV